VSGIGDFTTGTAAGPAWLKFFPQRVLVSFEYDEILGFNLFYPFAGRGVEKG